MWFLTTTYKVLRGKTDPAWVLLQGKCFTACALSPLGFLSHPQRSGDATCPQSRPGAGMDGCVPWWPLPPWAASDGKGQNGLSTVRSEKMKALTAKRCWENPTRCLALLVREGQPLPQGSAGKSHLFRLAQQVQWSPPGLPELVATF